MEFKPACLSRTGETAKSSTSTIKSSQNGKILKKRGSGNCLKPSNSRRIGAGRRRNSSNNRTSSKVWSGSGHCRFGESSLRNLPWPRKALPASFSSNLNVSSLSASLTLNSVRVAAAFASPASRSRSAWDVPSCIVCFRRPSRPPTPSRTSRVTTRWAWVIRAFRFSILERHSAFLI